MIGKQITKPVSDWGEYTQASIWCNNNNALIEDRGSYYEVVALPEKTAGELANDALTKAKTERSEAVSRITVEVDGMTFDGDETSQDRMTRAITMFTSSGLPEDTTTSWVLADNTVAQVTIGQLTQALLLAGKKQTELWTKPYEI